MDAYDDLSVYLLHRRRVRYVRYVVCTPLLRTGQCVVMRVYACVCLNLATAWEKCAVRARGTTCL